MLFCTSVSVRMSLSVCLSVTVCFTVQATVKNVPCTLMTSHLESTASHAAERKRQLKAAFDAIKKEDNTVIFGGDLNLRDKEVCYFHGFSLFTKRKTFSIDS